LFIAAIVKSRISIVKLATISLGLWFCLYMFVSAVFLSLNHFNVFYIVLLSLTVSLILVLLRLKKIKYAWSKIDFDLRPYIPIAIIFAVLIPFTAIKSDAIGPFNDESTFGSRTIELLYGRTNISNEFREYTMLDEEGREQLIDLQQMLPGVSRFYTDGDEEAISYIYHQLPVWPSLLALSAYLGGGIQNMGQILTVFYMLLGLSIYFILSELCDNKWGKYVGLILVCFSPLVIYLSKVLLSELLFACIVSFSFFLLMEKEENLKLLSAFSFGALGFVHLSANIYIPAICGILFIISCYSQKRLYVLLNTLIIVLHIFSLIFSYRVNYGYTHALFTSMSGRLKPFIGINISGSYQYMPIVLIIIFLMVLIMIQFLLTQRFNALGQKLACFIEKHSILVIRLAFIGVVLASVINGYLLAFTDHFPVGGGTWNLRHVYLGQGYPTLLHLNIVNILMATSYISIPIIAWHLIKKNNSWSIFQKMLGLVFSYSFLFWTVVHIDTPNNYYSSRYFMHFVVPIAIVLAISLVKKTRILIVTSLICIVTALPFNLVLLRAEIFKGYSGTLLQAASVIQKDAMVFIDSSDRVIVQALTHNLRTYNNNLVFPIETLEQLTKSHPDEQKYIISSSSFDILEYERVLRGTHEFSGSISSIGGYPLRPPSSQSSVFHVYRRVLPVYAVNVTEDIENTSGITPDNWTTKSAAVTFSFIASEDYIFTFEYDSTYVPLGVLGGSLDIRFYIYNMQVHNEVITENKTGIISFKVPYALLANRNNHTLRIETDTWNPAELFNSEDDRFLGVMIIKAYAEAES